MQAWMMVDKGPSCPSCLSSLERGGVSRGRVNVQKAGSHPSLRPDLMSPRNCPRLGWAILDGSPVPALGFTVNSVAQSWKGDGEGVGCWPLGRVMPL